MSQGTGMAVGVGKGWEDSKRSGLEAGAGAAETGLLGAGEPDPSPGLLGEAGEVTVAESAGVSGAAAAAGVVEESTGAAGAAADWPGVFAGATGTGVEVGAGSSVGMGVGAWSEVELLLVPAAGLACESKGVSSGVVSFVGVEVAGVLMPGKEDVPGVTMARGTGFSSPEGGLEAW